MQLFYLVQVLLCVLMYIIYTQCIVSQIWRFDNISLYQYNLFIKKKAACNLTNWIIVFKLWWQQLKFYSPWCKRVPNVSIYVWISRNALKWQPKFTEYIISHTISIELLTTHAAQICVEQRLKVPWYTYLFLFFYANGYNCNISHLLPWDPPQSHKWDLPYRKALPLYLFFSSL